MLAACLGAATSAFAAPAPLTYTGSASDNTTLDTTTSVAVAGHYAYTTAYHGGTLTAVDISNPAAPVVTGATPSVPYLVGSSTVNIFNGYAYVASKNRNASASSNDDGSGNSLTIVDVHTNPAQPMIVGHLQDATHLFGAYGITVSGHYAYVAAQGLLQGQPNTPDPSEGSFSIIDVSNPANPTLVSHLDNEVPPLPAPWTTLDVLRHITSVAISGHYAFVTAFYSDRLTVIDIANPASPAVVASLQDNVNLSSPADVTISGNYAYVADQSANPQHANLTIVDVSNPLNPQVVGSVIAPSMSGAYRVRLRGNFAYVSGSNADAVTAVDVSNPALPRVASSITDPGHLNRTTGLDIDPAGQYIVASSPFNTSESNQTFPPFTAAHGTITAIRIDPNPIAVAISPTSTPSNPTPAPTANFSFSASDAVSTARCQLDGGSFSLCTTATSQQYGGLTAGRHAFTIQATDAAGNTATTTYAWTVVISGPSISITSPAKGATYR